MIETLNKIQNLSSATTNPLRTKTKKANEKIKFSSK